MKVIFLDIDGVLNGVDYVKRHGRFGVIVDPERMQLLRQIVNATGGEIVLISSWREHWNSVPDQCDALGLEINRIFREYRLSIYDKTPDRRFKRAEEIQAWLTDYPTVTAFVIPADMDYPAAPLKTHHVLTSDENGGLCEGDACKAIRILSDRKLQ